jgi:iron-sulfur cluster repair protein YtfE (RIC family)
MWARVGDRLIVKGHSVGDPDRDAEILEVRGPDGGAPYVVRWADTGHETLFFPGPDATVQHFGADEAEAHATVTELVRSEHQHLYGPIQRILDAADALADPSDTLPDAVHDAYVFLVHEIVPHAKAEEEALYPAVAELLGSPDATAPMIRQHVEINRLVAFLGVLRDEAMANATPSRRRNLQHVLDALHAVLTLHLATEEELYLPLLDAKLSPRRSERLAEELEAAASGPSASLSLT